MLFYTSVISAVIDIIALSYNCMRNFFSIQSALSTILLMIIIKLFEITSGAYPQLLPATINTGLNTQKKLPVTSFCNNHLARKMSNVTKSEGL